VTGVILCKMSLTHQFLWVDGAAAVSIPSDILQLFSLAFRLDQTLPLLSSELPQSEVLSLPATFLSGDKQKRVVLKAVCGVPLHFSTLLYCINTHELVSRLPHLQQTPPPPIPTPTPFTLCSICTQGTVLQS